MLSSNSPFEMLTTQAATEKEEHTTMDDLGPWSTFISKNKNPRVAEITPVEFPPLLRAEDSESGYSHSSIVPKPGPQEYPEVIKEYGERRGWEWSEEDNDYVVKQPDGQKELFTEHQIAGVPHPAPASPDPSHNIQHPGSGGETQRRGNLLVGRADPIPTPLIPPQPQRPAWEEPLGPEFSTIVKAKRFFCTGRVFATVWFEPSTEDVVQQQPEPRTWSSGCPAFHGQKPVAKIRWFVVVKRRLHHSLCFTVTTYAGGNASRTNRSRPGDHAVLFRANIPPEPPFDDEDITRDPIAIIIEDAEYYISPIARLDCSRIYTVEDNLKVAKVGRVHPNFLASLEQYYRDIVL